MCKIESLIDDPQGKHLLRLSSRYPLTWDFMLDQVLPKGMSANETWSALQELRRVSGIDVPLELRPGTQTWYEITLGMQERIARIEQECRSSSALHSMLLDSTERRFLHNLRLDDIVAAFEFVGVDVDRDSATDMLFGSTRPQTPAQRMMLNAFNAEDSLHEYVEEPFSLEVMEDIFHRVADDVDVGSMKRKEISLGLLPFQESPSKEDARAFLERLVQYANGITSDPFDPVVLKCALIGDSVFQACPFGEASGHVGRLLSKLYAMKSGYPVLAYLPLTKARLEWEAGLIKPPQVCCTRHELDRTFVKLIDEEHCDFTIHQGVIVDLMCLLLDQLKDEIEEWQAEDQEMRELLQKEPCINQRQRTILARALRKPEATFTIRYHQRNHGVVYATARNDLLELVEKGYLIFEYRGRAMVFKASQSLESSFK